MPEYYVTTNILEDNATGKKYYFGEKAPNLPKEKLEILLEKGRISKKKPGEVEKPEETIFDPGNLAKAPPEKKKEE